MTFDSPHIRVKELNILIGKNHVPKNISIDIPEKK
jgi:ABC-type phosphate transport system ATPase subunit